MNRVVSLQTHDTDKLLQFEVRYEVQDYSTFRMRVRSGSFCGESSFCVSRANLHALAREIGNLDERLSGCATLHDYDSDAFVTLEGIGFGRITVFGQVGGTHQDQFARFRFETDQTVLRPFKDGICKLLDNMDIGDT